MATYVLLGTWTEQGAKDFANAPARARANAEAAAAMGGRIVATYWTMGKYDFVAIVEAPDDESMSVGALANLARGNVRSVTMRAFTEPEFEAIVARATAAG